MKAVAKDRSNLFQNENRVESIFVPIKCVKIFALLNHALKSFQERCFLSCNEMLALLAT